MRPRYRSRASFATTDTDAETSQYGDVDYSIRRVSTKARALDVKVFRGFSISASDYASDQHRNGTYVSETQAVDFLMKNYDDEGNYVMQGETHSYLPEIYFAATYHGADPEKTNSFARQNGIIGVVSAQLRRRAPLLRGSSTVNDSSTIIPMPHVYVANMRVDDRMRRRGVGKALLSSAVAHALSNWNGIDVTLPLVLSVENENHGAIQMYEQFGFEFIEKNSFFRLMILWPRAA